MLLSIGLRRSSSHNTESYPPVNKVKQIIAIKKIMLDIVVVGMGADFPWKKGPGGSDAWMVPTGGAAVDMGDTVAPLWVMVA